MRRECASAEYWGFAVHEELVLPAGDGGHLVVWFRVSRLSLAERCIPGCAVSVCATCKEESLVTCG